MTSVTITPKLQHLYHCRYGHQGARQICLFLGHKGDGYLVRKWLASSARWTKPMVIGQRDVLCFATRADLKKANVRINLLN
jgi:hypothetical protein